MMESKKCTKCGEIKVVAEFHKQQKGKNGLKARCKQCVASHYNKNKQKIKEKNEIRKEERRLYNKEWQKKNKEYRLEYKKEYRAKNKKKIKNYTKAYYKLNRDEKIKYSKKYRKENLDRVNLRVSKYVTKRRKEDALFKLKQEIRKFIGNSLKRKTTKKSSKTEEILGCSFEQFKAHIESKFKPGMSWERRSEFHIDHIIPLASAKTEEEVIKLCHYTNLQPLWAHENLSKGSKLPVDMTP